MKMSTVPPTAAPAEPTARIGRVLRERWRVDELVWTTPSSTLYWATHRTGTRAAIRVLSPALSADPKRAASFLETAATVQKIRHDGAVRILDDDTDIDGSVFLVLELFDAMPLRSIFEGAQTPMEVREAVRIAEGVLDVLAAAHHNGVQHGALRAEDVFLTPQGHVKLLGFEGIPLDQGVNFRRDTSAVGTLLYTMLAAEPPRGQSLAQVRPDLPAALVEVTDRALGLGVGEPWADAGAMLAALTASGRATDGDHPNPGGTHPSSFVPFPVTHDMNPLFVGTGPAFRPVSPSDAGVKRATDPRGRARWAFVAVVVVLLCVATALVMRQL